MTALTRLTAAGVPGRRRRRVFAVGTTPDERIYIVPPENRLFAVEAEYRVTTGGRTEVEPIWIKTGARQ